MSRKRKTLIICSAVVLLVAAILISAVIFASNHKKELYLFALAGWENLTINTGSSRFALTTDDGRVAVYSEVNAAKSEKLQNFLGEAIDGPPPYKYYHFGDSTDLDYVIRWTEDGYSLYEFIQYVADSEAHTSGVNAAMVENADTSEFTWGYLLESVYGVKSADDIECVIVSPAVGLFHENGFGRHLKIGHRVLSKNKTEELYSLLADVKFEPVSDPYAYLRYEEDVRFEFDFPTKEGETELDAAKSCAGRKITFVFSDGDVLIGCLYNGSYGTIALKDSYDIGGMAILPEDTAKSMNELLRIK